MHNSSNSTTKNKATTEVPKGYFIRIQKGSEEKTPCKQFVYKALWSRGESNPCPNIVTIGFLHAYFIIVCRHFAGNEQTNKTLS